MRKFFAQQMALILTKNSQITHLDLDCFSEDNDEGEGAVVLLALVSSNSLSTITHFRCGQNISWWDEGKENNVELLSNAIIAMTSLKYLNLFNSNFPTEQCDKVVSAIVENQERNPNL